MIWLLGVAILTAAAWAIWCSLGRMMALDELYTTTLIRAPSFTHMVDGAVRGVDGNPPLYLSLGWLLVHALPLAPEVLLRPLNLALLAATAVMLTRIGRRVADGPSVAISLLLLCALDDAIISALLEIRTYAFYLCLVTCTLWATLAVVDRPLAGRTAGLAAIGCLAALAHSFGGFYVAATILPAALVCLVSRDRSRTTALGLAALPAIVTTVVWVLISFNRQLSVATPYGWIGRPTFAALFETLTGSAALTLVGLFALAWLSVHQPMAPQLTAGRQTAVQRDRAILVVVSVAFAALTVAGWTGSQVITPFFVGRYFIPNAVSAAVVLFFGVAAVRSHAPPRLFAGAAALCTLAGLLTVATGSDPSMVACLDQSGLFLEDGVSSDLPIVTESPHAWLPRSQYAPGRTTLYPLDWDVVLNHPYRSRHNAMDFHIMEILKAWAPPGSALADNLLPTGVLLSQYSRFLLLDDTYRSWFSELRDTRPLSATLLRQAPGCRLWDVTVLPQP